MTADKKPSEPVTPEVEAVVPPVMTSVESDSTSVEEVTSVAPDLSQPTTPDVISMDGSDPIVVDSIDMGYTKTSSNKMLYVLVAVLALILVSLVGLFFYKQYTNTTSKAVVTPTPAPKETTVEKPSPTVTPVNDEEAELQDIVIEDIDADVSSIEADLKEL